jgi:hypothetical protein
MQGGDPSLSRKIFFAQPSLSRIFLILSLTLRGAKSEFVAYFLANETFVHIGMDPSLSRIFSNGRLAWIRVCRVFFRMAGWHGSEFVAYFFGWHAGMDPSLSRILTTCLEV